MKSIKKGFKRQGCQKKRTRYGLIMGAGWMIYFDLRPFLLRKLELTEI